jgi:uncharacterized SAM-binding protein YcdF (DUF218 family)
MCELAIPLGGGRDRDGSLTWLSRQRLEKAAELYKSGKASKVLALGGHYSTYRPNAIRFKEAGARLRAKYLMALGISRKDIVLAPNGGDTMKEAFASRKAVQKQGYKKILLVTSDKHMKRALFIFRRIFGGEIKIIGVKVPCGDILNSDEEREYYQLVNKFLGSFPKEIPDPDLDRWIMDHRDYYDKHQAIHDKYHPRGQESQAYAGVKD